MDAEFWLVFGLLVLSVGSGVTVATMTLLESAFIFNYGLFLFLLVMTMATPYN